VEERLARLEEALEEFRAENRELRFQLNELRAQVKQAADALPPVTESQESPRWRTRWAVALLIFFIVVVPVVALTLGHVNAFWSTVIGTLNAMFVYFIGPGAIRLLAEGLLRAIPGILLGQSARIAVDKMRGKKAR
jgi:hypothetical protein